MKDKEPLSTTIINLAVDHLSKIIIAKVMKEHPYYFNGKFERVHNHIKRMTRSKNPYRYKMMAIKQSCKKVS